MYFVKTPWYLKSVYPSLVWDMPKEKTLYLTFDDGPVPGVTDLVLDILDQFDAKATFFCIGDNVRKFPELFQRLHANGHAVGNHTYHHVNGWKTEAKPYIDDVLECNRMVESTLFRPPYGRIGFQQIQELKKLFNIIMWDVLSGDFDTTIEADTVIRNVVNNATDGSIIVFHDSEKASSRVLPALPAILLHFAEKGYTFATLPPEQSQLPKGLHLV